MLEGKYPVLLVDDEPALLDLGKIFLEDSGRFRVTTANSVQQALQVLKDQKFDAIVSDFQMPGDDGLRFLMILRTEGDKTPFILFTGKGREDVAIAALNNGADFYIRKGNDIEAQFAELNNAIMQIIKRRTVEALVHGIFEVAPLMLMIVDQDRCVHAFNKSLAEFAPVPKEEIEGKRCGVLLDCDNSRIDARGCGFSPNCKDCKVWGSVDRTIRTGESCHKIRAKIPITRDGVKKEVRLVVSTTAIRSFGNDLALMCIEDLSETDAS